MGLTVTTVVRHGVGNSRIESWRDNIALRTHNWSHTRFWRVLKKLTPHITYYNRYLVHFFAERPSRAAEGRWSGNDPALKVLGAGGGVSAMPPGMWSWVDDDCGWSYVFILFHFLKMLQDAHCYKKLLLNVNRMTLIDIAQFNNFPEDVTDTFHIDILITDTLTTHLTTDVFMFDYWCII